MGTVAIVGSGFSGTMVAAHLLRSWGGRVVLFERSGVFGPGLAYSAPSTSHLLNVPAGRMSAWVDRPDDFLAWGLSQGHAWAGGAFVPRRDYGRYLQDTLNASAADGVGVLERVSGEVVACRHDGSGFRIEWRDAGGTPASRRVDGVVLALGNFPPADPGRAVAGLSPSRYARDPWASGSLEGIEPTSPVLLVGTGLTMVDVALWLVEHGHRAPIHAVSRRGLLPQPHRAPGRPASYKPPAGIGAWERTTRGLLRHVREEIASAARRGVDWREVITSLRAVTPDLWRSLSDRDRAQFLRHVRAYWEVVRHRSAPSVDGRIQEMLLSGRLVVHSGRVAEAEAIDGGCAVGLALRGGGGERALRVGRIINCTGPECDPERIDAPLLRQMLGEVVIERDPLGQGVRVDDRGRPVTGGTRSSERLWLIGPLAKGSAWEITAVPELREHAAKVAAEVGRKVELRASGGVGAISG